MSTTQPKPVTVLLVSDQNELNAYLRELMTDDNRAFKISAYRWEYTDADDVQRLLFVYYTYQSVSAIAGLRFDQFVFSRSSASAATWSGWSDRVYSSLMLEVSRRSIPPGYRVRESTTRDGFWTTWAVVPVEPDTEPETGPVNDTDQTETPSTPRDSLASHVADIVEDLADMLSSWLRR